MKVEYNNLYTHFVFTTLNRMPIILEKFRDRIEKYITGIVNNNGCKMKDMSNFINKPFARKQMNEVMRLVLWMQSFATEVVLLFKLGKNEVFMM
ncbi:hypothetical protein FACS1894207_2890 [Bacteroidia bacterium]|nr:hypothetical protein FACS1894207_2890 [Bacteroidia bacterium]